MNDSHLTLRVPADLATALERLAESRGVPRSGLVREAIANYVIPGRTHAEVTDLRAHDFKLIWDALPHLTVDEAAALDTDLHQARASLLPPDDAWA